MGVTSVPGALVHQLRRSVLFANVAASWSQHERQARSAPSPRSLRGEGWGEGHHQHAGALVHQPHRNVPQLMQRPKRRCQIVSHDVEDNDRINEPPVARSPMEPSRRSRDGA